MSGIVTDSLIFAFDAIKLEHPILSFQAESRLKKSLWFMSVTKCRKTFETDSLAFPSCPFVNHIVSNSSQGKNRI